MLQRALLAAGILMLGLAPPCLAAAGIISQDHEIRIGRHASADLEAEVGLTRDPSLAARVAGVGMRVAAASDGRGLHYTFKVLRGREVNAVSLPGGFIYTTEGLVQFVRSDAELAFVMAHEVGHVAARHHVTMIERHFLFGLIAQVLLGGNTGASQIAQIVRFFLSRGFSREFEFEADRLAVNYAHRAGFDASAALGFMSRLRASGESDPGRYEVLLRTHPGLTDRMARMKEHLRKLGYGAKVTTVTACP